MKFSSSFISVEREFYLQLRLKFKEFPPTKWSPLNGAQPCQPSSFPDPYFRIALQILNPQLGGALLKKLNPEEVAMIKLQLSPDTQLSPVMMAKHLRKNPYFQQLIRRVSRVSLLKPKRSDELPSFDDIMATLALHCAFKVKGFQHLGVNTYHVWRVLKELPTIRRILSTSIDILPKWVVVVLLDEGLSNKEISKKIRQTMISLLSSDGKQAVIVPTSGVNYSKLSQAMQIELNSEERNETFSDPILENFVFPTLKIYKNDLFSIDFCEKKFPTLKGLVRIISEVRTLKETDTISLETQEQCSDYFDQVWQELTNSYDQDMITSETWNVMSILIIGSSHIPVLKENLEKSSSQWFVRLLEGLKSSNTMTRETASLAIMLFLESDLVSEIQNKSYRLALSYLIRCVLYCLKKFPNETPYNLAILQILITRYQCVYLPKAFLEMMELTLKNTGDQQKSKKLAELYCEFISLVFNKWPDIRKWTFELKCYFDLRNAQVLRKMLAEKLANKSRIEHCLNLFF